MDETAIQSMFHRFIKTARMHHTAAEKKLANLKIHRSQHMMLRYLARCGGNPAQKELAARFEISPAAVTTTIKKLEKNGFLERINSEEDNRCNNIRLTEKGKDILTCTDQIFGEIDEAMMDGFSDEEISILSGYLDRMVVNLEKILEDGKNMRGKEPKL